MSRKRLIWAAALAAVLVVAGAIAWAVRGPLAYAEIAAGYAAKQTCSCLYVSGRELQSCMNDLPEDARRAITVTPSDDRTVRASVAFGAISSQAQFDEGYGCRFVD